MGTKSKYTKEFFKKIEKLSGLGYPLRRIERVLGLKEDSLSMRKGDAKCKGDYKVYKAFTCAREPFIQMHLENMRNHATDDWRASDRLLKIAAPQDFSEKYQHELTGKDGGPVEFTIIKQYEKK